MDGEYILVVVQTQLFSLVNGEGEGRVFLAGVYRAVEYAQIAEHDFEAARVGEVHVAVKLNGSIRTAEYEIAVLAKCTRTGIEVVGTQPLFFGPVVECFSLRVKTAQAAFAAQYELAVLVRQYGVDVIGQQCAVVLLVMPEGVLVCVVD